LITLQEKDNRDSFRHVLYTIDYVKKRFSRDLCNKNYDQTNEIVVQLLSIIAA